MNEIVLAIAQKIPKDTEEKRPVNEFEIMAKSENCVLVPNNVEYPRFLSRELLEDKAALDIAQAKYILEKYPEARVYVSFSERVGIPLGWMLKKRADRPAHLLMAHRLDTRAKAVMDTFTGWSKGVDRIMVLSSAQVPHAEKFAPGRVDMMKSGASDNSFYTPGHSSTDDYILSVGSENRDYATLVGAVSQTPYKLKVLSSSPWSRKNVQTDTCADNIEFLPRVSFAELLGLYQNARMVVVPLNDVNYAAGLNGVLEAFCVQKPVVVSRSQGIIDYIEDEKNAIVVPCGDMHAMKDAICRVYEDDCLRLKLVNGARETVEDYANQRAFLEKIQAVVESTIASREKR